MIKTKSIADDSISRKLLTGLAKIGIALKSQSWSNSGKRGLTPTQVQILTLIHLGPEGGICLSDVAQGLGVTLATASDAVKALNRKTLLKKTKSTSDRRALVLSLTQKGKREVELSLSWPDFFMASVEKLCPFEQEVFLRVIMRLIRSMQEQGRVPVSKMCITCRFFKPNVSHDSLKPHYCEFVGATFGERDLRIECPEHEVDLSVDLIKTWETSFRGKGGER